MECYSTAHVIHSMYIHHHKINVQCFNSCLLVYLIWPFKHPSVYFLNMDMKMSYVIGLNTFLQSMGHIKKHWQYPNELETCMISSSRLQFAPENIFFKQPMPAGGGPSRRLYCQIRYMDTISEDWNWKINNTISPQPKSIYKQLIMSNSDIKHFMLTED